MPEVISGILGRITSAHLEALQWFERHEGEVGPRPWGAHRPTDAPAGLKLVARRGIHVPAGFEFALSVNSTRKSRYGDGKPLGLPDGTWLLPYAEHSGGDGAGAGSRWNRGLIACGRRQIPVGVTYEIAQSQYRNMGLALVEDYDPRTGFFLLHGPVSVSRDYGVWGDAEAPELAADGIVAREELLAESQADRRLVWATAREDQGRFRATLLVLYEERCAISGYDVPEALQAAHILSYSGRLSQVPENGLLLRADLHLLFDEHLLSIDPSTMRVELAPSVRDSGYAALHAHPVASPSDKAAAPSLDRLGIHHEACRRAWSAAYSVH